MRVDKLKEALNRPTAEDDGDTSSSQSNQSLPNINPSVPMKSKDVTALLDELNLTQHATSTVSLVNPPY